MALLTTKSFMEIDPHVFPKSEIQTHRQTDAAALYIHRSVFLKRSRQLVTMRRQYAAFLNASSLDDVDLSTCAAGQQT